MTQEAVRLPTGARDAPDCETAEPSRGTILLCADFETTVVMHDVARALRHDGFRVLWMASHRTWVRYLLSEGESCDAILDVRHPFGIRGMDMAVDGDTIREIEAAERRIGVTIGSICMMDRFTVDAADGQAWRYLADYYVRLKAFLLAHAVDVVIGEPTAAPDLMAYFTAASLGIAFYQISSLRIPSQRSALSPGIDERSLRSLAESFRDPGVADAAAVIASVTDRGEKPFWFSTNNALSVVKLSDSWSVFRNMTYRLVDTRRSVNYSIRSRIIDRLRRLANRQYVRSLLPMTRVEDIPRPFAVFGLQVQPERSVDVIAPFSSNQLELIKHLRRSLPTSMALVVKEHSNLLGGRGPAFFRAVQRLPNTYLVSPFADSHSLIAGARLVCSVSGTMCFEAALSGIPAITFASLFFTPLSMAFACSDPGRLADVVAVALRATPDVDADRRVMSGLLGSSLPCMVGDALSHPELRSPENVTGLARLIENALVGEREGEAVRTAPVPIASPRAGHQEVRR